MEYVIAVVVLSWLDDLHDKSIHISQLRHPQHPKLASLLLPLLLWWLHRLAGAGCSLRFLRRWLVLLVVGGVEVLDCLQFLGRGTGMLMAEDAAVGEGPNSSSSSKQLTFLIPRTRLAPAAALASKYATKAQLLDQRLCGIKPG